MLVLNMSAFSCVNSSKDCYCSHQEVCILVINHSGQSVVVINIVNKKESASKGKLGDEKKSCITFNSAGENSFRLEAILESGDTIVSGEVYSEGGYKFIGKIKKDTLILEYDKGSY